MNLFNYALNRVLCLIRGHNYDPSNKIYTPDWFDGFSETGAEQEMTLKALCVRCGDYVRITNEKE